MALTDYGQINQRTAAWAAEEMLAHAEPILVLSKFGLTKPLPKNKADNVKFRRPVPFTVSTTPAVEGVTPAAQQMQYADVSCSLNQYIGITEITDKVADMAEDPVLSDAAMLSGEQAAETLEMITYGVLKAGTNVIYANGSARTDVNTVVSLNDFRSAVRTLQSQRGKKITQMLSGSTNYSTYPIEAAYIAFCHTDVVADIRNLGSSFTPAAEYGSRKLLCPEEIGSVEDVRIIASPLLTAWADGGGAAGSMKSTSAAQADVYPIIVVAKDAYGLVPLKGANAIVPAVLNPGTPSKSDPAGQRGYVSWKTWYAAVRLNETWMTRIECAVTDI